MSRIIEYNYFYSLFNFTCVLELILSRFVTRDVKEINDFLFYKLQHFFTLLIYS